MEALIDEIMEELRVPANIPVLHECRTLFRRKVPLTMRAYVAAALAYRFSDSGNTGSSRQSRKDQPEQKAARPEARKAPQGASPRSPQRDIHPEIQKETQREPSRENRYHGEGVVLFVGAGRRQRFYARIALRMLIDSGQVQEEQIGDIRTMDNYSFINVDPMAEETAIRVLGGTEYKGRLLTVNRAKKKEDQATQD
jgi:hypothetical protein